MASSKVAFEEFQLQNTTAAIYVLDKTLYDCAVKLKEFLTRDHCKIKVCDESHDHWRVHIRDTIAETSASFKDCQHSERKLRTYKVTSTDVSIRGYGYLERLITEAKRRVEGRGLHHDVIILLGHSSVLLAEDKDLVETFAKLNPTIIAFLGCCGGNTRYGPILTMSYMLPAHCTPIIAFYQQQIYMEELENTSLIIGLQHYLHIPYYDKVGKPCAKYRHTDEIYIKTAKCAFALAKLNESAVPDPTVFINDGEGKNPVQMILRKCDLTTEAIPLSCMQLAMYSPMVVDSKEFKSFTTEYKWLEYRPEVDKQIMPTIPKESCLEHKVVIDDVLWHLDQQKIKITIHGTTQSVCNGEEIKISGTIPTEIIIEDIENHRTPQSNVKINYLQNIKITSPHNSEIEKKWPYQMIITLAAGRGEFEIINFKDDETMKLHPQLYWNTYICKTLISQDKQEIKFISQDLPEEHLQGITVDELSEVCWKKIEELQLQKIIPLVCEIRFIKLFNYTLELLSKRDKSSWKKIDPLQFLIAALRGYWGQIETDINIKKWATYYLNKSMSNVKKDNHESLHQYKLCCMCFVLLFEDSFVRFVKDEKDYHQYDIIVCIKEESKLNDVIKTDNSPQSLPDESPTDEDLLSSWVDLFQHCKPISDCVDLYNKDDHPEWVIGNGEQQKNTHNYKYAEFLLAMGALSDECQKKEDTLRKICYRVSKFENTNEKKGYMKYFSDDPEEIDKTIVEELRSKIKELSFIETQLLLDNKLQRDNVNLIKRLLDLYKKDPATWCLPDVPTLEGVLDHVINNTKTVTSHKAAEDILDEAINTFLNQVIGSCLRQVYAAVSIEKSLCQAVEDCTDENWHNISSCRFVFAQFETSNKHDEIKGILFYTDTHYGENLIVFNKEQLRELNEKCTCYNKTNCFTELPATLKTSYEERKEPVSKEDLITALKELGKPCRYRMLQITIKQIKHENMFPFIKVGRLTLTYNEDGQLTRINLDECAEHVAMETYKADAPVAI